MSQVSGQALVDLLNHAKENGALGIESMGWDGNPKVGKGGKKNEKRKSFGLYHDFCWFNSDWSIFIEGGDSFIRGWRCAHMNVSLFE